jgi:putative hemolysin
MARATKPKSNPFPLLHVSDPDKFLDVADALDVPLDKRLTRRLICAMESLLGIRHVREGFQSVPPSANPFDALVHKFRLKSSIHGWPSPFPSTGALIIVANHPMGGADALTLCSEVMKRRPDALTIVNDMLSKVACMRPATLTVAIMDNAASNAARNARSIKQTLAHLKSGGCIVVFPAGSVSSWSFSAGCVADSPWSPHIAALAQRSAAQVLPVFVHGSNPPWFHLLGAIHPKIRTLLIPLALCAASGKTVEISIKPMIAPEAYANLSPLEAIRLFYRTANSNIIGS